MRHAATLLHCDAMLSVVSLYPWPHAEQVA